MKNYRAKTAKRKNITKMSLSWVYALSLVGCVFLFCFHFHFVTFFFFFFFVSVSILYVFVSICHLEGPSASTIHCQLYNNNNSNHKSYYNYNKKKKKFNVVSSATKMFSNVSNEDILELSTTVYKNKKIFLCRFLRYFLYFFFVFVFWDFSSALKRFST